MLPTQYLVEQTYFTLGENVALIVVWLLLTNNQIYWSLRFNSFMVAGFSIVVISKLCLSSMLLIERLEPLRFTITLLAMSFGCRVSYARLGVWGFIDYF